MFTNFINNGNMLVVVSTRIARFKIFVRELNYNHFWQHFPQDIGGT